MRQGATPGGLETQNHPGRLCRPGPSRNENSRFSVLILRNSSLACRRVVRLLPFISHVGINLDRSPW